MKTFQNDKLKFKLSNDDYEMITEGNGRLQCSKRRIDADPLDSATVRPVQGGGWGKADLVHHFQLDDGCLADGADDGSDNIHLLSHQQGLWTLPLLPIGP